MKLLSYLKRKFAVPLVFVLVFVSLFEINLKKFFILYKFGKQ